MDFTKGSDANVQSCPSDTLGAALTELIKCCGKQEHMFLTTFYKHSQETTVPFQNTHYIFCITNRDCSSANSFNSLCLSRISKRFSCFSPRSTYLCFRIHRLMNSTLHCSCPFLLHSPLPQILLSSTPVLKYTYFS